MNGQDAPGAAPATPIKVFISYKTREHARYVDEISVVLRAAGFDVWYDEERKVPPLRTFSNRRFPAYECTAASATGRRCQPTSNGFTVCFPSF